MTEGEESKGLPEMAELWFISSAYCTPDPGTGADCQGHYLPSRPS